MDVLISITHTIFRYDPNDVNKIPVKLGKLIYLIPGLLAFLGLAGGLIYLGLFIIANIPS